MTLLEDMLQQCFEIRTGLRLICCNEAVMGEGCCVIAAQDGTGKFNVRRPLATRTSEFVA